MATQGAPQLSSIEMALEDAIEQFLPLEPIPRPLYGGFLISSLPEDNVVGIGVGKKLKGGISTDVDCIAFYVEYKFPKSVIPQKHLLPSTIDGLQTDVIEAGGRFRPFPTTVSAEQRRQRPAIPGCSVGIEIPGAPAGYFMAGTLGAVVDDEGTRCILSNNHVLANLGQVPVGTPIFQPGPADGGRSRNDVIAKLRRSIPIAADGNLVDCAIAEIAEAHDVDAKFPASIGLNSTETIEPVVGMRVAKIGRTTGYTQGVILKTPFAFKMEYPTQTVRFKQQILIGKGEPVRNRQNLLVYKLMSLFGGGSPFSKDGDSGSIIIDLATRRAVGLLCGGIRELTVANQLSNVLLNLNVGLVI